VAAAAAPSIRRRPIGFLSVPSTRRRRPSSSSAVFSSANALSATGGDSRRSANTPSVAPGSWSSPFAMTNQVASIDDVIRRISSSISAATVSPPASSQRDVISRARERSVYFQSSSRVVGKRPTMSRSLSVGGRVIRSRPHVPSHSLCLPVRAQATYPPIG
jgi:hypothetical protein